MRGLSDGSLPLPKFQRWLRQDYLFLIEYCRLLALGAARAPDLPILRRFADLLQATAGAEMDLHRTFAAEFGITQHQLEQEEMEPATRAYTDFLIRTGATGDYPELAAALLPCMWAFSEIGQELAREQEGERSRYARWIEMYASEEFEELTGWCRGLVDRLADEAGKELRARMETAFVCSSDYELSFWDMAWQDPDRGARARGRDRR